MSFHKHYSRFAPHVRAGIPHCPLLSANGVRTEFPIKDGSGPDWGSAPHRLHEKLLKTLYKNRVRLRLKMAAAIALALYFANPYCGGTGAEGDTREELERRLQRARDLTDIRSAGSPSFRLAARVRLFDLNDDAVEGSYVLIWRSPTAWQDDLKTKDFSQVRVADGNKLYFSRTPPTLFPGVFQILRLLEFPNNLNLVPREKPQDLREKKGKHAEALKIEIRTGRDSRRIVTLEEKDGLPTRLEVIGSMFSTTYDFGDFISLGQHKFPRLLREELAGVPTLRVEVQSLAEMNPDANSISPPQDSRWLPWCPDAVPARLLNPTSAFIVPPSFGPVQPGAIYGIIGPDGRWHNISVVKSAGKDMDAYMLKLLSEERYTPAMCGSVAIPEERVIATQ